MAKVYALHPTWFKVDISILNSHSLKFGQFQNQHHVLQPIKTTPLLLHPIYARVVVIGQGFFLKIRLYHEWLEEKQKKMPKIKKWQKQFVNGCIRASIAIKTQMTCTNFRL